MLHDVYEIIGTKLEQFEHELLTSDDDETACFEIVLVHVQESRDVVDVGPISSSELHPFQLQLIRNHVSLNGIFSA